MSQKHSTLFSRSRGSGSGVADVAVAIPMSKLIIMAEPYHSLALTGLARIRFPQYHRHTPVDGVFVRARAGDAWNQGYTMAC